MIKRLYSDFLKITHLRFYLGKIRYFLFAKIMNRLKVLEGSHSIDKTVEHNLLAFENIKNDFTMKRMCRLIDAATSIEFMHSEIKILVIGPRTESDLLYLNSRGYFNIIGVDLITYSPKIILGDMHALPFADKEFDLVISGWTISYSKNPKLALSEMYRVLKDEGVFAYGFDYWTTSQELEAEQSSMKKGLVNAIEDRINSINEFMANLPNTPRAVFFKHDAPLKSLNVHKINSITSTMASHVMIVAQK